MRPLILMSSLADGGAEHVTVTLVGALLARGVGATVCTVTNRGDGSPAELLREAGIPRVDLGARRLADPSAFVRYLKLLRSRRFDLVHAHGQDASILAAAARPLVNTPLILTRHVLEEPRANWRQRLRARAALAAARRADALIAVSREAADAWARLAGISRASVRVLYNGIDVMRYRRTGLSSQCAAIRKALGFGSDERLLLMASVLREGKGHEVMFQALPLIRSRVPCTFLLVAGSGNQETALRRQAAELGEAVRFLGSRQDVPELLAACDVAVLPSHMDALPTFLLEAAAARRPAVASRVGGIPEIIEHGRTGLLVPQGAPGPLADAILEILLNPSRSREMGAAAGRAVTRFSLHESVEKTLSVWNEVVQTCRH
jgi:glycosyltransferase involved in cell wall biosynthesis